MIHDYLENAHKYDDIHPNFRSVFNILQSLNLNMLEIGHIELDGNYVYINVDLIKGRKKSEAKLEAHHKYIDIQLPLSGNETFGWKKTVECMNADAPFNEEKDIIFYNDEPEKFITLNKGEFIIFFPEDAHAPCITNDLKHNKLIVKVSVEPNQERPTL